MIDVLMILFVDGSPMSHASTSVLSSFLRRITH